MRAKELFDQTTLFNQPPVRSLDTSTGSPGTSLSYPGYRGPLPSLRDISDPKDKLSPYTKPTVDILKDIQKKINPEPTKPGSSTSRSTPAAPASIAPAAPASIAPAAPTAPAAPAPTAPAPAAPAPTAPAPAAPAPTAPAPTAPAPAPAAPTSKSLDDLSFGQAFRLARAEAAKSGNPATGRFTWRGKTYQTNIKSDDPREKYVSRGQQRPINIK
jgi:hypothetical protein